MVIAQITWNDYHDSTVQGFNHYTTRTQLPITWNGCYDSAVQYFNHYTMSPPPKLLEMVFMIPQSGIALLTLDLYL